MLNTWFDDSPAVTAIEETLGLGAYGKGLTVIHGSRLTARAEEVDDEEDEE